MRFAGEVRATIGELGVAEVVDVREPDVPEPEVVVGPDVVPEPEWWWAEPDVVVEPGVVPERDVVVDPDVEPLPHSDVARDRQSPTTSLL